jgi:hypothetical protein
VTRALRFFAIAGCLLAAILCAWQIRSYWHREWFHESATMSYATSESGRLVLVMYGIPRSPPRVATRVIDVPSEYVMQELDRLADPMWGTRGHRWSLARVGWGWRSLTSNAGNRQLVLIVPHVAIALVVAGLSVGAWRYASARERHRRIVENHCLRCDYDLRGIDAGRCPECGEPAVARTAPVPAV